MENNDSREQRLALFVSSVLLRPDSPQASRLANIMYEEVMMKHPDSFRAISAMAEKEASRLIAEELPVSLLGDLGNPARELPPQLRPDILERIETRLKAYLASPEIEKAEARFVEAIRETIDRIGWLYGLTNLPEGLRLLRDKMQKQIKVYNRSIELVGPMTDLIPLYHDAVHVSMAERIRRNNDRDITAFYTALCENTTSNCTRIVAEFSRDLLKYIGDNCKWEEIISSNEQLLANSHRFMENHPVQQNTLKIFSNPGITKPEDLI